MKCVECRFWQMMEDDWGECRRNPPVTVTATGPHSRWPETRDRDWCGEFLARMDG